MSNRENLDSGVEELRRDLEEVRFEDSGVEDLREDLRLGAIELSKPEPIRFRPIYYPEREGCLIELDFGCEFPEWEPEFFPGKQVWGLPHRPMPKLDARLDELEEVGKLGRDALLAHLSLS